MLYNIVNKASGKNLNVNLGTDANGTNVIQWTNDGSQEQKFRLVYIGTIGSASVDSYKIFAMCSAKGSNRVVDVLRTGGVSTGAIKSGCNVDIWATSNNSVDYDCQLFKIQSEGSGYYSIRLRYNTSLALTSVGTANGSGAGNTSTSTGNVIIQTFSSGNANQLWKFTELTGTPAYPYRNSNGINNRTYYIDSTASGYTNFINTGAANWNPTIMLTKTSSASTCDVLLMDVNPSGFGAHSGDYIAVTYSCNTSDSSINKSTDGNWAYSVVWINNGIFPADKGCITDAERQGVISHELGHAFGLKDDKNISHVSNTIMYYSINEKGAVTIPKDIDRTAITNKY
ncbi:MAG: RICIN domain-containing protein, partial [Oscillospiraceae bacterium]|nr:RICIN domain-containing protein [Oscillospiraceae bacterium]